MLEGPGDGHEKGELKDLNGHRISYLFLLMVPWGTPPHFFSESMGLLASSLACSWTPWQFSKRPHPGVCHPEPFNCAHHMQTGTSCPTQCNDVAP